MPVMTGGYEELPDIGVLEYNGVRFDPLTTSTVSANQVLDDASRCVKYVEYTFSVTSHVTLHEGETSIDGTMAKLRQLLQQQGGTFKYSGKGFGQPFAVNAPGGLVRDVAYGPIPKMLDFQPLGANRAALVRWQVTTRIPEVQAKSILPVLQFNWDSSVGYDSDGYSSLTFKGTIEAPIYPTTVGGKEIGKTVDGNRDLVNQIASQIDLTRFKVTSRTIDISRDKRTLTFLIKADEQGPMSNPGGVYTAKGSFTCRPKQSVALVNWICTLRATYVVPKGQPQRLAWRAFVTLMAYRMFMPLDVNNIPSAVQNPPQAQPQPQPNPLGWLNFLPPTLVTQGILGIRQLNAMQQQQQQENNANINIAQPLLLSFEFEEGLYEDSRSVSFSASWQLIIPFRWILRATGWRRFQDGADPSTTGLCAPSVWAASVRGISGAQSWLANRLDPASCALVDFGS